MEIGKLPENVLKRSVLRQLKTTRDEVQSGAGVGKDCAIFSFPNTCMTAMQEAAVAVQTTEEGKYAASVAETTMRRLIHRTVNNLAAGGGEAVAVMIGLLLPTNVEEPEVKVLMQEAEDTCKELNIQIAGGQTTVLDTVQAPVAVVTGFGKPFSGTKLAGCAPGQDVVISKWIGLEGTAVLASKFRDRLLSRYPAYLVNEAAGFDRYLSVIPEAATAVKSGVCAMHDLSEGGVFGALWELAENAGVGLTIDMKKLPLRQETVEVCELCDANPYEMLSTGAMLMTAVDGQALADALEAEGIPAAIVGRTTDKKDRVLLNGDEVRYMDRPKNDALYQCLTKANAQTK